MSADYQKDGQIAVITLNNPPVNGLGLATRRAVVEGLERANAPARAGRFRAGRTSPSSVPIARRRSRTCCR
jgi:enoyl-CoA hydratase/carnithine racemase